MDSDSSCSAFDRGLCEIKTAFDMDMLTNPNVRNGFLSLMELLDSMGFKFGTYVWDVRYKGLDDYVLGQVNTMTNQSEIA